MAISCVMVSSESQRMTFPGFPEHSRGPIAVKAGHTRAASRSQSPAPDARTSANHLNIRGMSLWGTAYFASDAIRSTTDSRWAGERWLYRADIVIVLWPAAS